MGVMIGQAWHRLRSQPTGKRCCTFNVIVADGTDDAEARLKRVLRNDPGMGVIRHADAGYDVALDTLRKNHLDFKECLK